MHGTTGYEFANQAINLLVDAAAQKPLTEFYDRFTGIAARFPEIAYHSKLLVMRSAMSGEVNVLGHMLNRLSETNRWFRDFTLNALTAAVREVIACFPVYRTYLKEDEPPSEQSRKVITRAIELARRRNPALERTMFDFSTGGSASDSWLSASGGRGSASEVRDEIPAMQRADYCERCRRHSLLHLQPARRLE